jgi:hypothetical protein
VVVKNTPPGVTVVGIPAKVVQPETGRRMLAGRIDLDHHRMPPGFSPPSSEPSPGLATGAPITRRQIAKHSNSKV